MTLGNKYNEVMDKIEVTEEMRNRILQNIANEFSESDNATEELSVEKTAESVETPIEFADRAKNRKKSVYSFTRYIGVAAAAVVLLIGASAVFDKNQVATESSTFTETANEFTQEAAADLHKESEFIKNSWVKYESVEKMAEATGADFREIGYLNDISSDTDYYLDGGSVATIVYDVSGNAITVTEKQETVAKVEESDMISQAEVTSFNASEDAGKTSDSPKSINQKITVGGVTVTVNGTEDGFGRASWVTDGIEYTLDSADKLSLDEMTELLENVLR